MHETQIVQRYNTKQRHCEEAVQQPTWQSGPFSFWHIHLSLIPNHRQRNSPELLKRRLNGGLYFHKHRQAAFSLVRGIRREKGRSPFSCMAMADEDLIRLACGQPPDADARAFGPPQRGRLLADAGADLPPHRRPYGVSHRRCAPPTGACRPVLAGNSPLDCFPGARTPIAMGRFLVRVGHQPLIPTLHSTLHTPHSLATGHYSCSLFPVPCSLFSHHSYTLRGRGFYAIIIL